MVGIRSGLKLEAPLAFDGQRLVDDGYLERLTTIANSMFESNVERIDRFEARFRKAIADNMAKEQDRAAKEAVKQARRQVGMEGTECRVCCSQYSIGTGSTCYWDRRNGC